MFSVPLPEKVLVAVLKYEHIIICSSAGGIAPLQELKPVPLYELDFSGVGGKGGHSHPIFQKINNALPAPSRNHNGFSLRLRTHSQKIAKNSP